MNDFKIKTSDTGELDIDIGLNDIKVTDDIIENLIIVSLFTNARNLDSGGFWGDSFLNFSLGGREWLLAREKMNNETFNIARQYAIEALNWLIASKLIKSFNVKIEASENQLNRLITVEKLDGKILEYGF